MAKPDITQSAPRLFGPGRVDVEVIGGDGRITFGDLYHSLLSGSWWLLLTAVVLGFFGLNALFALGYLLTGGVVNAQPGSLADAFFFSVQTFGTIGYGAMFPHGTGAEVLVVLESLTGLLYTALVTGLLFAKFARPTARVMFSKVAVVSDRDGVPTLMFRIANRRRNHVVEATARVGLVRTEVTKEGERVRRVLDLQLVRAQTPVFILTWTVLHPILPDSPLYGQTAESLAQMQAELVVTLTGIDETLSQAIHARHSFLWNEVIFGARLVDVLSTHPTTRRRQLDYRRFHDWQPASLGEKSPSRAGGGAESA